MGRLLSSMKLPKRLYSQRGVFLVLLGTWCFFVLLWKARQISEPSVDSDFESLLYGEEVPEILAKISGSVEEVPKDGIPDCPFAAGKQLPFIVRGFAKEWGALHRWTFQWVQNLNVTADVGSVNWPWFGSVCLGQQVLREEGPSALPAVMIEMPTHEAIQRMMTSIAPQFENLFYNRAGGREFYYIRFDLDEELLKDTALEHHLRTCDSVENGGEPRLWVSVKGSVSPMHWDSNPSCLVQIRGTKRMLFYSPQEINVMGTYPWQHLLWRRAKFNPAHPDYERFPEARDVSGILAVLSAGDLVCFPPRWLHYTDCPSHSVSITMRLTS